MTALWGFLACPRPNTENHTPRKKYFTKGWSWLQHSATFDHQKSTAVDGVHFETRWTARLVNRRQQTKGVTFGKKSSYVDFCASVVKWSDMKPSKRLLKRSRAASQAGWSIFEWLVLLEESLNGRTTTSDINPSPNAREQVGGWMLGSIPVENHEGPRVSVWICTGNTGQPSGRFRRISPVLEGKGGLA